MLGAALATVGRTNTEDASDKAAVKATSFFMVAPVLRIDARTPVLVATRSIGQSFRRICGAVN
jgi:hypothetical protein